MEDLRPRLQLDKHALDDELIQQASMLHSVSEAYEEAMAERDDLKEKLATVDAELDQSIRDDAEEHNEKLTEGTIKAKIQADVEHKKAYFLFASAKLKAGKLQALKDAFKERGYMLRELCSLYLSNYFEHNSVKPTQITENASYKRARVRLADTRAKQEENVRNG